MGTVRTGARSALVAGPVALLVLLATLADTVGLGVAGWLAGLGCGLVTTLALSQGLARRGAVVLGAANAVTLVRAMLVAAAAALVADSMIGSAAVTALVTLAGLALALDAVDGRVARRTRSVSPLGARFDMEVDALLILVLSGYVARVAGPWVLAIGLARYAFVAAGWLAPWLRAPAPPRAWCKVVAAVQGVVLTVAAAGVLPAPVVDAALGVALLLLAESFGRQVWWLSARRASPRPIAVAVRPLAAVGTGSG